MLRFKDHEWLNIGGLRVTHGELLTGTDVSYQFGGKVRYGGADFTWSVEVALPPDGGPGFSLVTRLRPLHEPVELLEALTTLELPYEYDGAEEALTVLCQQPVYWHRGQEQLSGAGCNQPIWHHLRANTAHLTAPSASPLLVTRVCDADGGNRRYLSIIGDWNKCSFKDMIAHPSRSATERPEETPFPDPALVAGSGKHGHKYLVGALNWTASLQKDPNVLVTPSDGLAQALIVDYAGELDGPWEDWLARGWERMALLHFPAGGKVPAYEIAKSRGATWVDAAEWLSRRFDADTGTPGFFHPERGVVIYAAGTRPRWDTGSEIFCGQWAGPLAYYGRVCGDATALAASELLERCYLRGCNRLGDNGEGQFASSLGILQKALITSVSPETLQWIGGHLVRRTAVALAEHRWDGGVMAWLAQANLLAALLCDRDKHESLERELLENVNRRLETAFWSFNCSREGDTIGAGQARPFGHAAAVSANVLAWRRFGNESYLSAARRFGNLLLGMHYIAYNESPTADLDTRGWAHGSTGGRDQVAQIPPWESGYSLQQLAHLLLAGWGREGFYDLCWLHAHTGLAQFPKARTLKRIYRPDMSIVYRPLEELPTERVFYRSFPYMAYENPWDQTMLAGYQGVEPIVLSLFLGGGLAAAEDDRVLALIPEAGAYVGEVESGFTVELWNPLREKITTRLYIRQSARRGKPMLYTGAASGRVEPANPWTEPVEVPPRLVVRVRFVMEPGGEG